MRVAVAVAVVVAVLVVVGTTVGLVLGLRRRADAPSAAPSAAPDLDRVCAERALSTASCERLKYEYEASQRNAVASCDAEHADADARLECVAARITRLGAAADLLTSGAVYPENYAALRLRVDSQYVCESGGALVVGGAAPVLVRFAKRGGEWTIETPDAARVVVVGARGELALAVGSRASAAAFAVGGTPFPSSVTLAPVARDGAALRSVAGASVEVRLERPVAGLLVEVKLTASELSRLEYSSNVAAIDTINRSGCCVSLGAQCTPAQRQRYPLCCGCADSDARYCAWKASVDASVVDEGALARLCCSTRARMLDVGPDYADCGKHVDLPGQYAKCGPSDEHTFTFVPAGVWGLAPNGVRLPAYGRVLFMRTARAGYRGVRCT